MITISLHLNLGYCRSYFHRQPLSWLYMESHWQQLLAMTDLIIVCMLPGGLAEVLRNDFVTW